MGIRIPPQIVLHVQIRKFLIIIGIAVSVLVLFQCLVLPYAKTFSQLADNKSSEVTVIHKVFSLNNSEFTKFYAADVLDNDTFASDMDRKSRYADKTKERGRDIYKGFVDEKGVIIGKSLTMAHDNTTWKSSAEFGYSLVIEEGRLETSNTTSFEAKPSTGIVIGEFRNQTTIMSIESQGIPGKSREHSETRTSDSFFSATLKDNAVYDMLKSKRWKRLPRSISEMNSLLLQTRVSSSSMRPRWSSRCDKELLSAKREIEKSPIVRTDPELSTYVFRNVSRFKRSYELMERTLKVHIYREGEKPIFHQPHMRGIYASEGWFMKLLEGNKKFTVKDPKRAHLFYLPFSSQMLRNSLLVQNSHGWKDLENHLKNYVKLIGKKYRFWNRTGGSDHFLVACHDWASKITRQVMKDCIRCLCNANVAKGFKIGKDTTLPVTYVRSTENPTRDIGGRPYSERPTLAFFAGSLHGYLRPFLLHYWENKHPDMKILGPLPRDIEGKRIYREHMKNSKYCICARGYEVHTPRVVEAIFYECVPVIISDNYVPPFFEVLNWESFSVFVQEREIPDLRNILLSIPEEKYRAMQMGVKSVQKHFIWHKEPVKYDLFHMVLHSLWHNRVYQIKSG